MRNLDQGFAFFEVDMIDYGQLPPIINQLGSEKPICQLPRGPFSGIDPRH